jgi:asparaginyl-tRNA synthetase
MQSHFISPLLESLKEPLTCVKDIFLGKKLPGEIQIAGWVRTKRSSKKFSFIEVNDGSCAQNIQVIADAQLSNYELEVSRIISGYSVWISGKLVESLGQGQKYEIQASEIKIVGAVDESYPLQKKEMSFDYLRENADLRPRTSTFAAIFRLRSLISFSVHEFFQTNGFHYVHTPIITATDGEGAGEAFKVTNLNFNQLPKLKSGEIDFSQDFFEQQAMLCVTGQLEAELMAMGLGKVYTFGPTFRAENSNTTRHLAEFWMVEPEMAFWNLHDTMQLSEDLVRFVVGKVFEKGEQDLNFVADKADTDPRNYLSDSLNKPFVKVSYTEAVDILTKSGQSFEYPVLWGSDLKSEHERFLCEKHFKSPTIVYNYPEELKAFYMYLNEDNKTVRAMDCLMPGIGEVFGGSQREDRLDILCSRMAKKGLHPESIPWYLNIRKYGNVPHSGFGMGLERLVNWITGMGNIRDVTAFPRYPKGIKF